MQVHTAPQNNIAATANEICLAFGLTKEELVQVCKVQSRKTLYSWINSEAQPRKLAMDRMFDLLIIARAWTDSDFSADRKQVHEPVIEKQSVFDLLNEPKVDKERILFAGSRLKLLSPTNDVFSDLFA